MNERYEFDFKSWRYQDCILDPESLPYKEAFPQCTRFELVNSPMLVNNIDFSAFHSLEHLNISQEMTIDFI
jgi:hypothetical protein